MAAQHALVILFFLGLTPPTLASLYHLPPPVMTYHHGPVLSGPVPVSLLFYGLFSPHQRSVVSDFIRSLSPLQLGTAIPLSSPSAHSVAQWWSTVDRYVQKSGRAKLQVVFIRYVADEGYSMGKLLTRAQVARLATTLRVPRGGIAVVLTADDVAVEGFCTSACGLHGTLLPRGAGAAYAWVGNPTVQCPGRCAWPFHSLEDGGLASSRLGTVLHPPNGDVGVDGMVINLAVLLAGMVTNPYGTGYFQGDAAAPVEVAAACPGVYGRGAYPGYAGALPVDQATGGSYNVIGVRQRKYLVPALVDPVNHSCLIMA